MTYANYKPNYGVSIEMKGNVSTSHQPTDDQDYYYSSVDDATNSIVTARTTSVQPATTNRVPNRPTENVISDSQLKTRFNTINDDINLLKKTNYRLKIGLIISLFVIIVAIVAGSATAVIFKQNIEDSLKRKAEAPLANTNKARVSEGTWAHWTHWDACSATCNVGVRRRTRTCNGIGLDGLLATCSGNDLDISICNDKDCTPRVSEGIWHPWSNWGVCSSTCNVGVRSRRRTCNGLRHDGLLGICSGNNVDFSSCNNEECAQAQIGEKNISDEYAHYYDN